MELQTTSTTSCTSPSPATSTSTSSSGAEFQMNLLLQLQQTMLNFQSQLTEFSIKLAHLEAQQEKLVVKVEDGSSNGLASVCQVSSSSATDPAILEQQQAMANDISLLATRVLELEDKVGMMDKQQQEQQQQIYAQASTAVEEPEDPMNSQAEDKNWNYGGGQGIFTMEESEVPTYYIEGMSNAAAALGITGIGVTQPEIIISEFDHQSAFSAAELQPNTCYVGRATPPPQPRSQPEPPPYTGETWFTDKLDNRIKFEVNGNRLNCPSCHRSFNKRPFLKQHYNEKHCDPTKHKCVFCGLIVDISNGTDALVEHVKSHEEDNKTSDGNASSGSGGRSNENRFKCKVCPNTFAKAENLACHYTISHYQAALDNLQVD